MLVACSDSRELSEAEGGKDGMVLVGPDRTGLLAGIRGTIDTTHGCVTLAGSEGGLVLPFGTTWDEERQVVVLPDGRELSDGDPVSGGGGFTPLSTPSLRAAAIECGWSATADTAWLQTID